MATFDYAGLAADVDELIAEFGQSATLRKMTNSGDAWAPTRTPSDKAVTVVDLEHRVRDASGSLAERTRRTLYVRTSEGVEPKKGDKVQIGSDWHEIEEVRTHAPGGTAVLYEADLAD